MLANHQHIYNRPNYVVGHCRLLLPRLRMSFCWKNVSKTELMFFSRNKLDFKPALKVKNMEIKLADSLKVLGVKFEPDLGWDLHIRSTIAKVKHTLKELKFIARFINKKDLKVVRSHIFGQLFYGSPVWLGELTRSAHWKLLNSIHYRAVRLAIGDCLNMLSRHEIDRISGRCNPRQWMEYSNAKIAITLYCLNVRGLWLTHRLKSSCYINDRKPGIGSFTDTSRLKIGHHSLPNRLKLMKRVTFDWTQGINKHSLRINLKRWSDISFSLTFILEVVILSDWQNIVSFMHCDCACF